MKPKKPISRRRKIILYYTLAVVLPGIILGYLSFRGIRNDQAFREKESKRILESESRVFFSALDSGLTEFIGKQTSDTINFRSGKLDPSVLALFVTDTTGKKNLISHQLLYLPTELNPVQPGLTVKPPDFEEGQKLEFIDLNYSAALKYYQDRALNDTSQTVKGQSLLAVARLYKRLNQPEKSKYVYEEIRRDYPGCLLNGQIPMGLSACLEILKISRDRGDQVDLKAYSIKFLDLLIHPACEYDENQFDLFYQVSQEFMQEASPAMDSLYQELDRQKARTAYLLRIIMGQDLEASNVINQLNVYKKDTARIALNSNELAGLYFLWNKDGGNQTGIVIDLIAYVKSRADKLIHQLDPDSGIDFILKDNNGSIFYSRSDQEGIDHQSFQFPESFPDLHLLMKENKTRFLSTLFSAGSGVYLSVIVLIALLMVLGFIFTLHTLNQELVLNKLKSEFISNVSHELKSPLTSIRMMTEMLHLKRVPSDKRKSEYYAVMLDETEHLSHLIDNILDFSRIEDERKKYHFADFDLNDMLIDFLDNYRKRLTAPGFNITYDSPDRPALLQADQESLHQVFYNLLDNAVKYSGESRKVKIKLTVKNGGYFVFVKDYGIGISRKDQEKIFERFYRSDEPQMMGIKGSGIGLTIVKRILDAHEGHLTVESKQGEGSTFCVYLPKSKNIES